MAFRWVFGSLVVTLALWGRCYASSEGSWCYTDPHCGPNTWTSIGKCGGKRQSPIDIVTADAIHNSHLGALTLSGYDDHKKLREIKNTGKTVDIELADGLHLSGPELPATYTAKSFHFHWGNGVSKPGSEHLINGNRYSMELHIVHTKNNMSVSDARKDPEGIAVLAFFIEGSEKAKGKTAEVWKSFTENLEKVSKKGKDSDLDSKISLLDLLDSPNLSQYYRYLGSLTTPECDEVVLWTVFHEPILVPTEVVKAFPSELRTTDSANGPHLENNFRPVQETGNRKVEVSFSTSPFKNPPGSSASLTSASLTISLFFLFATSLTSFLSV